MRISSVFRWLRSLSTGKKLLLCIVLALIPLGGFVVISGEPGFCNSCHIMNPYYDSWKSSEHSEVNCLQCHIQPGFAGFVRGKVNGLAQAIDCVVGRTGPKPNATVKDVSCLRADCHQSQSLVSQPLEAQKGDDFKFAHKEHIGLKIDGIDLSCAGCHSHFEGTEHFEVNKQVCVVCHFVTTEPDVAGEVKTKCQSCHDVPTEPVKRGKVEIDHGRFVRDGIDCEELCHKNQVRIKSVVDSNICLNCHDFSKTDDADCEEVHRAHMDGEKVECFACHGMVEHEVKPIKGKHFGFRCIKCHASLRESIAVPEKTSINIPARCDLCHESPHAVRLNKPCGQCHAEHGWESKYIVFSHDTKSAFVIDQIHSHLACVSCHKDVRRASFKLLPTTCEKCHENIEKLMHGMIGGKVSSPHPHAGRVTCVQCHQTDKYKQSDADYANRCRSCHTEKYGQLYYDWKTTFETKKTRAEEILSGFTDEDASEKGRIAERIREADETNFHNLDLANELWNQLISEAPPSDK